MSWNPNFQPAAGGSRLPANPMPGAAAALALRNALSNPYAQQQQQQQQHQFSAPQVLWPQATPHGVAYVTPQGYSISSTYNPMAMMQQQQFPQQPQQSFAPRGRGAPHLRGRGAGRGRPQGSIHSGASGYSNGMGQSYHSNFPGSASGSGYAQSGHRCTHEGCSFAGTSKNVEIHMMDRHLIYPPGWVHRKKGDWDADPSLNNGKPVPIPGTGITLDTPEAIDAWIAERKKRYPTSQRVTDKKQKLEEAVARGDLLVNDKSRKRKRADDGDQQQRHAEFGRGRARGRGWGTFSDRGRPGSARGGARPATQLPPKPVAAKVNAKSESVAVAPSKGGQHALGDDPPAATAPNEEDAASSSSDSDDDSILDSSTSDSDMDPVLDAVSSKPPVGMEQMEDETLDGGDNDRLEEVMDTAVAATAQGWALNSESRPQQQKRPRQPRPPPQNPFANRPSLLHSLLQTEIRATVSNLSQAIRFVVQNDFLEGVELNPGDADSKLIEVIGESAAEAQ